MLSQYLVLALLGGMALAVPQKEKRQATNPAEFSSAANQLVSIYVPISIAVPLGAAVQSAASANGVSGDANAIFQEAIAASTLPAFFSAVPSQYQPNLVSLNSAINALRGVASTGIPGAPVIATDPAGSVITTGTLNAVTTTNPAGTTIIGVTGPVTDSAGNTLAAVTSTLATPTGSPSVPTSIASQPTGAVITTDASGSTITGLAVTTTNSAGSTITSLTSTFPSVSTTTSVGSTSVSSTTDTTVASTTSTATSTATSTDSSSVTTTTTSSATSTSTSSQTTTTRATTTSAAPASGAAAPGALAPGVGSLVGLVGFLLAL
ncbi:MAG: U4/U6-U5 snRNP complex subunit prp31 [Watsoniomyces obsoletus]|nr:MAG: U4/U6-U5 snRNP complex subunit prp31 [Watsoniomyces obsoletus]